MNGGTKSTAPIATRAAACRVLVPTIANATTSSVTVVKIIARLTNASGVKLGKGRGSSASGVSRNVQTRCTPTRIRRTVGPVMVVVSSVPSRGSNALPQRSCRVAELLRDDGLGQRGTDRPRLRRALDPPPGGARASAPQAPRGYRAHRAGHADRHRCGRPHAAIADPDGHRYLRPECLVPRGRAAPTTLDRDQSGITDQLFDPAFVPLLGDQPVP